MGWSKFGRGVPQNGGGAGTEGWARWWWAPLLYLLIPATTIAVRTRHGEALDLLVAQLAVGVYASFKSGVLYAQRQAGVQRSWPTTGAAPG